MAPTLYMIPPSPPVRAVQICAKHLNIELNLIRVNILKGENLTPEFLKLNPTHTVPVLVDEDGTVIWESHAIMIYLLKKYGNQEQQSLYPDDAKSQGLLHQMMHYDSSMFGRGRTIMMALVHDKKPVDEKDKDNLIETCKWLDQILNGRKYAIGDVLTLADFSLIATVSSLPAFLGDFDFSPYENVCAWMKRIQALPAYEANLTGLEAFKSLLASFQSNEL